MADGDLLLFCQRRYLGDINGPVYNGLVRYDKDLNIEGELAESWEISADNLSHPDPFICGRSALARWALPYRRGEDVLFTYWLLLIRDTTYYAERYRQVAQAEAARCLYPRSL
ncbi:MAG: hypothetical protein R2864_06320 [Syntrophotaleaceae bacterium]